MPLLTYSNGDFIPFTKILSADVNAKFNDIKLLLNTTKLDTTNIQQYGVARDRMAAGTPDHVVINAPTTGYISSEAQLATTRGGLGFSPTISLSTAGQAVKVNQAGTGFELGAVATGLGLESIEQSAVAEHFAVDTPAPDNSVKSGFSAVSQLEGLTLVLMSDYTASGSTIDLAYSPIFINDSDKDMDSTTGWTAVGAGTNIGLGTPTIGTDSISFDKDNSATSARIRYDRGAADFNMNGQTNVWVQVNLPSVAGVSSIELRADVDGSNYQTFTTNTQYDGSALATGYRLYKFDLSTGGSATGTGWDSSKLLRYFHVGVITASAGTTLTGIEVDSLFFSKQYPERLVQIGDAIPIYDTTNKEVLKIDAANTRVDGRITLTTALTNSYVGGSDTAAGYAKAQTMSVTGDNAARMDSTLAGAAATSQNVKLTRILRTAQTGINIDSFADVYTEQVYDVTAVGGGTIDLDDLTDTSADLLSGDVVDVFRVVYEDGKQNFINRGSATLSTNSSFSGGTTTVTVTVPAGTAIGDVLAKRHVSMEVSLVNIGANESFSAGTLRTVPDGVIMQEQINPYPNEGSIAGHYLLGSSISTALAAVNLKGTLPDLTVNGTIVADNEFLNGRYSSNGFNTANYYSIPAASAAPLESTTNPFQFSFWFKDTTGFTGTLRRLINRNATPTHDPGWSLCLSNAANHLVFSQNGTIGTASATYNTGEWNHVFVINKEADRRVYLNGTLVIQMVNTGAGESVNLFVGRWGYGPSANTEAAAGVDMADLVFWVNGTLLTVDQINDIYNNGVYIPLGETLGIRYRYQNTGMTGQKLTTRATLVRSTTAITPSITAMGSIKT